MRQMKIPVRFWILPWWSRSWQDAIKEGDWFGRASKPKPWCVKVRIEVAAAK